MNKKENTLPADNAEFVGLIYDSSLDKSTWPLLLDSLEDFLENNFQHIENDDNIFKTIAPHLKKALNLKNNYSQLEQRSEAYTSVLDNMPVGLIFTDKNRRIVLTNKLAEKLLQQGDTIKVHQNKFEVVDINLNKNFVKLFAMAIQDNLNMEDRSLSLNIKTDSQNLSILINNNLIHQGKVSRENRFVTILLAPSKIEQDINTTALSALFNLTASEAKLSKELASGMSIEEIAKEFCLSKHTVRTQLKSIFGKTGTTRQAELVTLILTSPAAFTTPTKTNTITNAQPTTIIDLNAKRLNQQIELSDGRKLGFAEYGPAQGEPVFLLHSLFGCRFEKMTCDIVLEENNIRLIIPEYSGFGLSDFDEQTSYINWADDLHQLKNYLGLPNCAIIGYSMGARFALAYAYKYPSHVNNVQLVSGFPPYTKFSDLNGMTSHEKLLITMTRYAPGFVFNFIEARYVKLISDKKVFFAEMDSYFMNTDRISMDRLKIKEHIYSIMYEALKNGVKGFFHQTKSYCKPAGYKLSDINTPVKLWHGLDDKHAPIEMGKTFLAELPNVETHHFIPGSHMLLFEQWDDIMKSAASRSPISFSKALPDAIADVIERATEQEA